jgi:predicted NAD-dependent protein-ADP-ribosyltransferase YbiA (DUF1768 family)
MERTSYFVNNKAIFGGYPIQEEVNDFESLGVRYFVDLTYNGEKRITPYKTKYEYINYPIRDHRFPTDWESFAKFITKVGDIIKNLEPLQKVYLHCKAGHGRSGVVVACLLCYLYNIPPSEALSNTNKYHSERKEMREKWRKIGCPQTRSQKHFVSKFFEPLYIYNNYTKYFSSGFNNDANIAVIVPGFGSFPTATSAFNALKDPTNTEYVSNLEIETDIVKIRNISESCKTLKDWDNIREHVMYTVIKCKFNQNISILNNFMSTGLRPIIVISADKFWGKLDNSGHNTMGKLFIKLRNELYTID